MSALLHGSAEWPHAGILDDKMKPKAEGRWACHLSLFYATERVPDAINVLQVHGHNVQYSPGASPPPPSRRIRSRPGPGRAGTSFVVAASTVAAHPEPPGARPVRPGLHRRRLRRRGAPGAARGPAGLARPSSSLPPPSPARRIRSSTGPCRPGPTFVVAASAVATHPDPPGARPARPGLSPS